MEEALGLAVQAARQGEVPVGAVVVDKDGRVIGRGSNNTFGANDPCGHAEIVAIREACRTIGNCRLNGAFLVVTLEPCLMCAGAMIQARLAGVVYGAPDQKAGAISSRADTLNEPYHNHRPWHCGGVLQDSCARLLEDFFLERRLGK